MVKYYLWPASLVDYNTSGYSFEKYTTFMLLRVLRNQIFIPVYFTYT